MDLPNADSFSHFDKVGYLLKQCGRGFPYYLHQWKRRYCILKEGRLFIYEKENSRGSEKTSTVIDLKYFDHVAEIAQKESKKASNVFVVTSQDRSFFDPGRHLFAADTLSTMHEWIEKLRESIELIRNNNRAPLKKGVVNKGNARESIDQTCNSSDEKQRRGSKDLIQEISRRSRRGSKRDVDTVDSVMKKDEKIEEGFVSTSEKRKSKEAKSHYSKTKGGDQATEEVLTTEGTEVEIHSKVLVKLSATKKISLQAPSFELESERLENDYESKRLESVTKHRNRGPSGRRAPQHRRLTCMKHRASSMSALQHGVDEEDITREQKEMNRSADLAEGSSLNTSHPVLAYHYSSEEDSPGEDNADHEDYFGIGASALHSITTPPSPPPRSASYNIEVVPHHPVEGLSVYIPPVGYQPLPERHAPLPLPLQEGIRGDPEYRSLPRALGRGSSCGTLGTLETSGSLKLSKKGRGSISRISSGRASPEMDALDNMLMNESVRPSSVNKEDNSDHDSSDGSTCKVVEPRRNNNQLGSVASARRFTDDELSKALESFSSALQHLQHHTAELECRTKRVENEFIISKKDVGNIRKSSDGFRKDLEKLTESFTLVSQEASKVKMDILSQQKETERVQRAAAAALSEAKNSRTEFETAKNNYESLIRELQSVISSIRTSLVVSEPDEEVGSKDHKGNLYEEPSGKVHFGSEAEKNRDESKSKKANTEVKKSVSCKESGSSKASGYQSFFQRPTSLIHSLANRTSNKSNSGKSKKEQNENNKQEHEKKNKSNKSATFEKKTKGEKASQNSLEKKSKSSSKKDSKNEAQKDDINKLNKRRSKSHDEPNQPTKGEIGTSMSNISLENFPMMDEPTENMDKKLNYAVGISHISINVSPPPNNFQLEKSMSSPSVLAKFPHKKPSRPNVLNIKPNNRDTCRSSSNTSSPDSPTSPLIPFTFGSCGGYSTTAKDSKYIYESSLFPTQPPPIHSPANKQPSSMLTPEERLATSTRPGVFAISRQSSTPNLPLQRQSSAPVYPLQRQHSLGTVPEEGQLPRQASLMSVPEDRPITDQTLPLSPSPSMISFPLSHTPSGGSGLDILRDRSAARNSMELVTGPVISGSAFQESFIRQLPPSLEFERSEAPMATSSLKKPGERKKNPKIGIVV